MVLLICVPIQLERSNDEIKIPLFPLSEQIPSFYISLLIRIIGFVRVLCIDILFIFMHAHDCVCVCVCVHECAHYTADVRATAGVLVVQVHYSGSVCRCSS